MTQVIAYVELQCMLRPTSPSIVEIGGALPCSLTLLYVPKQNEEHFKCSLLTLTGTDNFGT